MTAAVVEVGTWVTRVGQAGDLCSTQEAYSLRSSSSMYAATTSDSPLAPLWSLEAFQSSPDEHAAYLSGLLPQVMGADSTGHTPEPSPALLVIPEAWHHRPEVLTTLCSVILDGGVAPAVYFARPSVCWTLSHGVASALVADMGHASTRVTAVVDGYALVRSFRELPEGGRVVASSFRNVLPPDVLTTLSSQFVGASAHAAAAAASSVAEQVALDCVVRSYGWVPPPAAATPAAVVPAAVPPPSLTLQAPDGAPLELTPEQRGGALSAVAVSVAHALSACRAGLDPETRAQPMRQLLTGGVSRAAGMQARVAAELCERDPTYLRHAGAGGASGIESARNVEGAWAGASMVATSSAFDPLWITSAEWREEGESVLLRKLF